MTQQTCLWLRELRLGAMEKAYAQQLELPAFDALGFDERRTKGSLRCWCRRRGKAVGTKDLNVFLKAANLKDKKACLEEIDFQKSRNIDKSLVVNLSDCRWIRGGHNVLISGACGTGKTYLASALGNAACRQGYKVRSYRLPRLLVDIQIGRGDGSWDKILRDLKKTDLLILDDFGLAPLEPMQCRDFLEVVEDRYGSASTVISSQLPVSSWHSVFADATIAEAVLDRLLQNAHRFELKGPSRRQQHFSVVKNEEL